MNFSFDSSVTAQQRHWVEDALARCTYTGLGPLFVQVLVTTVEEPPVPGHNDYMATEYDGEIDATIYIREGADDPTTPINRLNDRKTVEEVRLFFTEAFIHEVGHVVSFMRLGTDELKSAATALFRKQAETGEAEAQGALADWNPDGRWEDKIQEATAEVFKDTFLDERYRLYENRTDWEIDPDDWVTLIELLQMPRFPLEPRIVGLMTAGPVPSAIEGMIEAHLEVTEAHFGYQNLQTGIINEVDVTDGVEINLVNESSEAVEVSGGPGVRKQWDIEGTFPTLDDWSHSEGVFVSATIRAFGFPGGNLRIGGQALDAGGLPYGGGQGQESLETWFITLLGPDYTYGWEFQYHFTGVSYFIPPGPDAPSYPYEPETISGSQGDGQTMRLG